ncbi:hypothetical protein J3E72DRAFT_204632 [Bipolaris maydis]|nr:hypothetical protein J3E74DRAFT_229843 [Bipolaris maydis]KAJ5052664.1 hypothetical protein J3E74DRAFT_295741 [Bipolaris maydis]KAJ6192334.1 hypothetical protein J3E72DRAFT_204632 [Bipolaris maydis]KAJ6203815.1 hypothetical protein PSV09DRAFT_2377756 [Bipolaris maydis]
MKRRASDSDIEKALNHRAWRGAGALSTCTRTWKPPSPKPTLSKQALSSIDQHTIQHLAKHPSPPHIFHHTSENTWEFIRHWLDNCGPDYEPHTMPAHTPLSKLAIKRHSSRHHRNTPDTQSSTYTKTPSPQTYRSRNLKLAGIYIDKVAELPPKIDKYIRHILGITSWEDRVTASNQLQMQPRFNELAEKLIAKSKEDASRCMLEAEWQTNLNYVLRAIADILEGVVQTNTSEKIWNADLKPRQASLDTLRNKAQDGTQTPMFDPAQTSSPRIDPNLTRVTDSDYSESTSPPSHAESAVTTTSTPSTDVASAFHIRTPKPDITVGLADEAFTPQQQLLLTYHQAKKSILSEPHAAEMGIRFPFMIAETKGWSEKGTLMSAQNQAAVGGACMLKILKDLTDYAARGIGLHPKQESPPTTPEELFPTLAICFSVVSEGPIHELWVHFEREDEFHMHNLNAWRTTKRSHAEEFVNCLGRIIEWGKGDFKQGIVQKLG